MDGGVRRGTDVMMALALGAAAVLVGRARAAGASPWRGRQGVPDVLRILRAEVENAMMLCGARDLAAIGPGLIAPAPLTDADDDRARATESLSDHEPGSTSTRTRRAPTARTR